MKKEDPISSYTMIRSRARLQGYEKEPAEERAQGEAIEAEVGDTNEEINRFTLGPKDIPPSPP